MAKKKNIDAVSGAAKQADIGVKYGEEMNFLNNWIHDRSDVFEQNIKDYANDRKLYYLTKSSRRADTENEINRQLGRLPYLDITYDKTKNPSYHPRKHIVNLPLNDKETTIHELTHALNPVVQEDRIKKLVRTNYLKHLGKYELGEHESIDPIIEGNIPYYFDPGEIYSRMMELRYFNKINPKSKVTKEDVKGYRKKNDRRPDFWNDNMLFKMFDDNTISRLLNEIAVNDSKQQNVYGNKYMQDGGTMDERGQRKRYFIDLYDDELYSLGGWLDDNRGAAGGFLTGASSGASIGSVLGPLGTGIGAVVGGISGLVGGSREDDERFEHERKMEFLNKPIMPRSVGLANMTPNVMHFKKGGNTKVRKVMKEYKEGKLHSGSKNGPIVKDRKQAIAIALSEAELDKKKRRQDGGELFNDDLIEVYGPSHEEGGVDYMPGIEVEGGETIRDNVVNSDNWTISKDMARHYNLPKISVGKTPAQYSKMVNDKYKGREDVLGADKTRDIELKKITAMSDEMGEILGNEDIKAEGGQILPNVNIYGNRKYQKHLPQIGDYNFNFGYPLDNYNLIPNQAAVNRNTPWMYENYGIEAGPTSSNRLQGMFAGRDSSGGMSNMLGLAPIVTNAALAASTAMAGYDKVKLPRRQHHPMHPELIDPSYQVQQARDAYATGNEQMSQMSKKDWLRRRIQSATEEEKTLSGIRGTAEAANKQLMNQAEEINAQSKLHTDLMNMEISMQEEMMNQANKGAWQSARDYYLSNMGTMLGEYGRDQRLGEANEVLNDRILNLLRSYGKEVGVGIDDNFAPNRTASAGVTGFTLPERINLPSLSQQANVYGDPTSPENLGSYNTMWRNRNLPLAQLRYNRQGRPVLGK